MSRRSSFGPSARRAVTLAGLAMLGVLGGCQYYMGRAPEDYPIPPDLGLNRLMALPHPFRPPDKDKIDLKAMTARDDISLLPVSGLTSADNERLAQDLVDALDAYDILVLSRAPQPGTYRLEGVGEKSDSGLAVSWRLYRADGTLAKAFEVGTPVAPGAAGDTPQDALKQIAGDTAKAAAGVVALAGTLNAAASQAGAGDQPSKIAIGAVTGAPGNGDEVLPIALKATLGGDGLPIADDAAGAAFILSAAVAMGAPKDGKQAISITWTVDFQGGGKAGEIKQDNDIPAGSLDGDWGATAYDIAVGAENGLLQLFNEIEASRQGLEEAPPEGTLKIPAFVSGKPQGAP